MMENKSYAKRGNLILVVSLVIIVFQVIIFLNQNAKSASVSEEVPTELSGEELLKRGQYLVNTSGCHDCHSPKIFTSNGPEPDTERLLSGHPSDMPLQNISSEALESWLLFNPHLTTAVGPWGITFGANLTSDETGIGNWSEEQFFKAIREGKYKGLENSRPLLPPMPWQVYRNMTDGDLHAIFTYLKSTTPIHNVVPAPIEVEDMPLN